MFPLVKAVKVAHWAAPCMSGAADIIAAPPLRDTSTTVSRSGMGSGWPNGRPPMALMKMSCWRHKTPLGMPVVPPV